jgi:hypothetical protein
MKLVSFGVECLDGPVRAQWINMPPFTSSVMPVQ